MTVKIWLPAGLILCYEENNVHHVCNNTKMEVRE